MLRADEVMERFELLAELTPEEAERYRVLCADAALHVKNMLQHEAPEEADRLFCFAAAALAAYRKALADSGAGEEAFSAGDLKVTRRKAELQNARALWEDSVTALEPWLRDKGFEMRSVRYQ